MRRALLIAGAALVASSCGYVGDPLVPALNIPQPVQDLRVRQVGATLTAYFTIPKLSTENLALTAIESVDLRVGKNPEGGWNVAAWEAASKPLPVAERKPGEASGLIDVASMAGQDVVVAVRLGNRKGRLSQWSNLVNVKIEAAVAQPAGVRAESAPEGALVIWTGASKAAVYRDNELLGEAEGGRYLDKTAELGKTYSYQVQSMRGAAFSEMSAAVSLTVADTFPPAVPSGLSAIAGTNSVELTWERNTEADLKGYRLQRAIGTGPLEVLADFVDVPAYSDRTAQSGQRYRYVVSAIDLRNNASAPTQPVEITVP